MSAGTGPRSASARHRQLRRAVDGGRRRRSCPRREPGRGPRASRAPGRVRSGRAAPTWRWHLRRATTADAGRASVAVLIAARAPGTSVFRPCRPPSSSSNRVLAAPETRSTRPREVRSGIASRFSGIVSDSPRQSASSPATNAARPPAGTRTRRRSSPAPARRTPPGAAPATGSARPGRPGRRSASSASLAAVDVVQYWSYSCLNPRKSWYVTPNFVSPVAQVDRHGSSTRGRPPGSARPGSRRHPAS